MQEENNTLADDPNYQDIPDVTETESKPFPHASQFSYKFHIDDGEPPNQNEEELRPEKHATDYH